jgi:hypothetical protein
MILIVVSFLFRKRALAGIIVSAADKCLLRRAAAQVDAVGSAAGIVHHEAVEVDLAACPVGL